MVISKNTCHIAKHSGTISDNHAHKILALDIANLFDRQFSVAAASKHSKAVALNIPGHLKHIAHNRAGRRHLSGASSIKHRIIHRITVNKYSIKYIIDRRQRMFFADQCRMYADLNAAVRIPGNAEQLDHTVHILGIFNILRGNMGNSLGINIIKGNSGMEADGTHDRHLTSCIQTFHIGRRIGFCITKLGSLRKGFFKFHAFLIHFGQNIIRRTIDNAHNLRNLIRNQALFQRPDNRNTAGTGCFKHKIHTIGFRSI